MEELTELAEIKTKTNNLTSKILLKVKKSPLKKSYFAEKLGIFPSSFSRKIKNLNFSIEELEKMTKLLITY